MLHIPKRRWQQTTGGTKGQRMTGSGAGSALPQRHLLWKRWYAVRHHIRRPSSLVIGALIATTRCKQHVILFVSSSVLFSNFVLLTSNLGMERDLGGGGGEAGIYQAPGWSRIWRRREEKKNKAGVSNGCVLCVAGGCVSACVCSPPNTPRPPILILITSVEPCNLCVSPLALCRGMAGSVSAENYPPALFFMNIAHNNTHTNARTCTQPVSSFSLILSNVKLDHLFPYFFSLRPVFFFFFSLWLPTFAACARSSNTNKPIGSEPAINSSFH